MAAAANPVGTQQQLTTFSPPTLDTYCSGPQLAYSASTRKTLGAWVERVATSPTAPQGGMVRTAFINGDAALSSTPVDISTTLFSANFYACELPAPAAGPDGKWLVVWPSVANDQINGQVLDASGNPSGPNLVISSNTNYADIETVSAAWSPQDNRYLVSWKASAGNAFPSASHPDQGIGRFVDSAGAGVGSDFLITDTSDAMNNSQDLAYGNGRWLWVGATMSNIRVVGQVVTASGPQGSLVDVPTTGSTPQNIAPSVAYNASTQQFAVVYRVRNSPYDHYLRLLDSTGVPVGGDVNLGPLGNRPRIASAGSNGYLVVAHGPCCSGLGPVSGLKLLADGTPDGAAQVMSDAAPFVGWRPSVAYDPSQGRFITAYAGNNNNGQAGSESNYFARAWFVANPPVALTVTKEGTGAGTVTSSPAGIDCGATCAFDFDSGASVTLTASAASGSAFAGWGGACSGAAATCTVTMDAAKSVAATFNADAPTPPTPPSNTFKLSSSSTSGSSIRTRITVPGAGRLSQRGTRSSRSSGSRAAASSVCSVSRTVSRAGTYTLSCKVNSATRKAQKKGKVRVLLRTTFAPTGGTARTVTRTVTLPSRKPRYTG